jgi:hypothetical protein
VEVRVEALGVDVVRRQLLSMAGRTVDASPAMGSILDGLFESTSRRFATEGAHGGDPWKPLAQTTVEAKARQGLDPRIEHATLELRDSLTRPGGANVAVARHDGLSFSSTVEHAQYAADRGDTLVQPTELERRQWVRIVQAWIIEADRSPQPGLLAGVI